MKADDEVTKCLPSVLQKGLPPLHIFKSFAHHVKAKYFQVARLDFIFQPESVSLSTFVLLGYSILTHPPTYLPQRTLSQQESELLERKIKNHKGNIPKSYPLIKITRQGVQSK